MGKGGLGDLARRVGRLGAPVPEAAAEAVRPSAIPRRSIMRDIVASLITPLRTLGNRKPSRLCGSPWR